jgi:predicted unusual protein kinase regulating ubiquinone biosynthesis (AarF/ABC1/UbiB family)
VPGGRLVFYDFGMMDEIPEPVRKREENVIVFFTNKEMGKRHEKIVSSS